MRVLECAAVKRKHGMAIAALVLGIVSILIWWLYVLPPLICAFIAILLARRARREIGSGRGAVTSIGIAQAAEVCGWVGLVLSLLYVVAVTIIFFTFRL